MATPDYRRLPQPDRIEYGLTALTGQGLDIETAIELVAMAIPESSVVLATGRSAVRDFHNNQGPPLANLESTPDFRPVQCPLPVVGVEPNMLASYAHRFPTLVKHFASPPFPYLSADGKTPLGALAASASRQHAMRPAEYAVRYAYAHARAGLLDKTEAMWFFRCFSFGFTQLSYASRRRPFDFDWYARHVFAEGVNADRTEIDFAESFAFYLVHSSAAAWGEGPRSRPRDGDAAGVVWMTAHAGDPDYAARLYFDGDGARRPYKTDYASVRNRARSMGLIS